MVGFIKGASWSVLCHKRWVLPSLGPGLSERVEATVHMDTATFPGHAHRCHLCLLRCCPSTRVSESSQRGLWGHLCIPSCCSQETGAGAAYETGRGQPARERRGRSGRAVGVRAPALWVRVRWGGGWYPPETSASSRGLSCLFSGGHAAWAPGRAPWEPARGRVRGSPSVRAWERVRQRPATLSPAAAAFETTGPQWGGGFSADHTPTFPGDGRSVSGHQALLAQRVEGTEAGVEPSGLRAAGDGAGAPARWLRKTSPRESQGQLHLLWDL